MFVGRGAFTSVTGGESGVVSCFWHPTRQKLIASAINRERFIMLFPSSHGILDHEQAAFKWQSTGRSPDFHRTFGDRNRFARCRRRLLHERRNHWPGLITLLQFTVLIQELFAPPDVVLKNLVKLRA